MYALLTSPNSTLPTVMNMNSHWYPDMIQSGYTPIKVGTKLEIEAEYDEMILEFSAELD